mgnify:CR=1 FL=1
MQIVSYGSQDLFLTGNPEITYFKVVYRRHTNFATEAIKTSFDDPTGFGKTSNISLKKIGDLIYNTYLVINIPEFNCKRAISQQTIDTLTDKKNRQVYNYNLVKTFLERNMTAYREAYNLYLADNITTSNEIIECIINTFSSYNNTEFKNLIADDYYEEYEQIMKNGGILYRYENMRETKNGEIHYSLGNISLESVRSYWSNPSESPYAVSKEETMNIINFLIQNCIRLDKKYYDKTYDAQTELNDAYNENYKFAWVDKLGHSIIDYIEFYVGGKKIDTQYGQWIDIWHELTGKKLQEEQYSKMIGNISTLTSYDRTTKPQYELKIPLQFFFNQYSGMALPLISMQYSDISIRVKLRKFSECAYVEADNENTAVSLDTILENQGKDLTASLLMEYVFLDSYERRKFAQSSHEYLIKQIQLNYEDNLNGKTYQTRLDFQHPCTGLIWVLQRNSLLQNLDGHTKCCWTTYTTTENSDINPIYTTSFMLNNENVCDNLDSSYFNNVQPIEKFGNSPATGINSYWFSIFPKEMQPSGSCNLSRISNIRLEMTIDPFYYDNDETYTVSVYAINYNILRIIGGIGGTAYC